MDNALQFITLKEMDSFLRSWVKTDSKCKNCEFNHDRICFFAYECITNEQKYFKPTYHA